ncbi:pimeloyl-ACP methyl ester carboxylesterase [Spinactinospora alkalitolerans]|uniref:Pimeloyl-ACP methyl ester carboxylesterase n=1 Tax=Spinactinospora alkalitolerans TaxID=687207 RepID=A0A852TTT7_9ACTN|nr:lipase family protein [Spinactinospora alkalitolerans]NYE47071.1 pimeloyl-ACP methyl ester carboxylesterase [Spinactinospora alkalitolerans]
MTTIAFDHTTTDYRLPHARCLAYAAQLAYEDEEQVEQKAREWGFDRVRFFRVPHTPPFPLEDTQAYAMASDDMVIIAFRGTQAEEIRDWLSDANAPMVPHSGNTGMAHWGFSTALEAVYPDILDAVREFRADGQSLWFTGHSLGGALAMLAAARMHFVDGLLADGVYTFGQPRTCDAALADAYDTAFRGRMFRFVNNSDIVAQVPPEPIYRHVAEMKYFDADGRMRDRAPSLMGGLADRVKGHTADVFAPGTDGIRDHYMDAYIARLDTAAG